MQINTSGITFISNYQPVFVKIGGSKIGGRILN